jgi:hypothetical protein
VRKTKEGMPWLESVKEMVSLAAVFITSREDAGGESTRLHETEFRAML